MNMYEKINYIEKQIDFIKEAYNQNNDVKCIESIEHLLVEYMHFTSLIQTISTLMKGLDENKTMATALLQTQEIDDDDIKSETINNICSEARLFNSEINSKILDVLKEYQSKIL